MNTYALTLFEHESHPFEWDRAQLLALERLNRLYGTDVVRASVRGSQPVVQATEFVGIVRLGHYTIQVLPKIYSADTATWERVREATRNLLHLLAYARDLPIREYSVAALFSQDADWFEILTRLFATHLMEEWERGAYRTYQTVDDELPVLKGKWRISDQVRHPTRQSLFSVAYDEFSGDNALNRVFRFVVERLWHLTRDAMNRQRLGELRQWMEEVTLLPSVTATDASPALLTRLNQRYEPLLNLACLFLEQRVLHLAAHDITTFAFVFDMNQLFETFVAQFIRRHRAEVLPSALVDCEVLPQTRGRTYYLATRDSRDVFELKPDLALRRSDGTFPVLVDTKYKELELAKKNLGVSPSDFYQMYAYTQRYNCPRVILLYPQTASTLAFSPVTFQLHGVNLIRVATVDIRVDLRKSSERQKLISQLKAILEDGGMP